jgi:hypothetical protein
MIEKSATRSGLSRFRFFPVLLATQILLILLSACGLLPLDRAAYTASKQDTIANTGISGNICSAVADADGNLYLSIRDELAEKTSLIRWKDGAKSVLKSFRVGVYDMFYIDGDIFFLFPQELARYHISTGTVEYIKDFGCSTNGMYRFGNYLVVDTEPGSTCVVHVFRISDCQETQSFQDSERGWGWFYAKNLGRGYRVGNQEKSIGYRNFDAATGTFGDDLVMGDQDAEGFTFPRWLLPDESYIVDYHGAVLSTSTLKRSGNIGIEYIVGMEFEGDKAIVFENRYDLGDVGELEVIDAASPYSKLKSVRIFDYWPDALVRQGNRFFVVLSDYVSNIFIYEYSLDELL